MGLVIVSHSAKLAAGVAELARAVAGPDVRIAATGGLSQPDQALGTDAQQVLAATAPSTSGASQRATWVRRAESS